MNINGRKGGDGKDENNPALTDVSKTMKSILPTNCTIDADALDLVKRCVLRFISSVSSEAVSRCIHSDKTQLTSDEILMSLDTLGYEEYIQPGKLYIHKLSSQAIMKRPIDHSTAIKPAAKKTKKLEYTNATRMAAISATQTGVVAQKTSSNNSIDSVTTATGTAATSSSQNNNANGHVSDKRLQAAILFAINNPNTSIKRVSESIGMSRTEFKEKLNEYLNKSRYDKVMAAAAQSSTNGGLKPMASPSITSNNSNSNSNSNSSSSGAINRPGVINIRVNEVSNAINSTDTTGVREEQEVSSAVGGKDAEESSC